MSFELQDILYKLKHLTKQHLDDLYTNININNYRLCYYVIGKYKDRLLIYIISLKYLDEVISLTHRLFYKSSGTSRLADNCKGYYFLFSNILCRLGKPEDEIRLELEYNYENFGNFGNLGNLGNLGNNNDNTHLDKKYNLDDLYKYGRLINKTNCIISKILKNELTNCNINIKEINLDDIYYINLLQLNNITHNDFETYLHNR